MRNANRRIADERAARRRLRAQAVLEAMRRYEQEPLADSGWRKPVMGGQTVYRSIADACRTCNVDPRAIHRSIETGEAVGGVVWAWPGQSAKPAKARKAIVDCRGRYWRSIVQAAGDLGVSHETVRRRLRDGRDVAGLKLKFGPDWGTGRGNFRSHL
jgi:hypothetical protein